MMTTSEMLVRKTPPSIAVAPVSAYSPGLMSHDAGSTACSARPPRLPTAPPSRMLGMKTPPGSAMPNDSTISPR